MPAGAFHAVVIRSTVPPGTVEDVAARLLASFQDSGLDVAVAMCPEFLREGTGIADFYSPPYTVIGSSDLRAIDVVSRLFSFLDSPAASGTPAHRRSPQVRVQCLPRHQDLLRQRTWTDLRPSRRRQSRGHGALLRGRPSQYLAQVLAARFRLRRILSSKGPSFSFSIWHAPRASTYRCSRAHWRATGCRSTKPSTESLPARGHRVALLGLSFKPGSDDLRESPYVDLAETLLGKGYEVRIHDAVVNPSSLVGANRQYVESKLPHLKRILTDGPKEAITGADVALVSSFDPRSRRSLTRHPAAADHRPRRSARARA